MRDHWRETWDQGKGFFVSLFIYFIFGCAKSWLLHRLSVLQCAVFSLQWLLLLQSMDSRHGGSVVAVPGLWSTSSIVVVRGLRCSEACGIFLDQGSNPCLQHWPGRFPTTRPPTPRESLLKVGDAGGCLSQRD